MLQATLWVIGSVLVYVAAAYVWWRWDESAADGTSLGWGKWRQRLSSPAATVLLRALYYVGVPYVAMLLGAADFPIHLGLAQLDWPASIGTGALVGVAVFLGLTGMAAYSLRNLRRLGVEPVGASPPSRGAALLYEALFLEAHWAFYRLPGILATGDFLLGSWIGAAVAIVEQVASPRWRDQASSKRFALQAWQRLALLVGMSAVFFFTKNLWVTWVVHVIVEWGYAGITRQWLRRVGGPSATA